MELYITKQAILWALLMLPVCYSQRSEKDEPLPPDYGKDSVTFSSGSNQTTFSYHDLEKQFPNVFFDEDRTGISQVTGKTSTSQRRRPTCELGVHDGDQCCGTCRYFVKAPSSITTVSNQTCWVLHLGGSNPKYQYLLKGECSTDHGSCHPKCTQQYGYHQLLCWLPGSGLQFVFHEVPAYCSCMNSES